MIVVTGMHRSGTSLVAMTLESLGVNFGDHSDFYAADQWNAKGYFERRDVMDINNRMITGLDRTGSSMAALLGQARYLSEPNVDAINARGAHFAENMAAVAKAVPDGAVKDPRFCLTWPAWNRAVHVGATIVCLRHPLDVADSLRRRQRIPVKVGLRFWRYHMRALAERTPPGLLVVELDSLTSAPERELDMMVEQLRLPIETSEAMRRFHKLYTPSMTRTEHAANRTELDPPTMELWEWLTSQRPIPLVSPD